MLRNWIQELWLFQGWYTPVARVVRAFSWIIHLFG